MFMIKKITRKFTALLLMTCWLHATNGLYAQEVNLKHTAVSQFNLPVNQSGPETFGGFIHFVFKYDCWTTVLDLYSQLDAGFSVNGSKYRYQGKTYDLNIISQYDHRGLDGLSEIRIKSVTYLFKLSGVQFTKSNKWTETQYGTAERDRIGKSYIDFTFDCEKYTNQKVYDHVTSLGLTITGISSARFENTEVVEERIKNYIKFMQSKESYDKLIKQADDYFNNKDYTRAKQSYESALKVLPDQRYPEQQLKKIEDLQKQADEKAKNDKVNRLNEEGDKALAEKNHAAAKAKYEEALGIDPANAKAKSGIQNVDKAIEEEKKSAEAKEKTAADEKAKTETAEKEKKEAEDKANAEAQRQEEAAAEAQRQEEARLAEEKRKQEEELARQKRQQEYYDRHNQQDQQNLEGMALVLAFTIGLEVKLGQWIYTEFPALSDISVGEPNDSYKFSMKAGYSISMNPLKPLVTEEDYDGNNYSYTDDSTMRNSFTLNANLIYEFYPLYGKHFGYGFRVNGAVGHGFTLQDYKVSYGVGTEWYAGAEHLQLYHRLKYGGDMMGFKPWLSSRKIGGGKSHSSYIRNEVGLRLNVDGEYQSHFYFGFLYNRSRQTQYSGLFPLMKNGEKGVALRFENEFGWNLYFELISNYLAFGEDETTVAATHSSSYKSTYFTLGFLSSINVFGTNFNVLRDGSSGDKSRFRKNFISFMSPNVTILHTKTPGLDKVDKLRLGLSLGYEREIPLKYPLSVSIGGHIHLMKGGTVTNSTSQFFSLKYNSFDIPLGIKLYLTSYQSSPKYWVKPALVPSFNFGRNVESNLSGFRDFKGATLMTELAAGVDYMLGLKLGGRFSVFVDYGLGNLSDKESSYLRQTVIGFKGGFIF